MAGTCDATRAIEDALRGVGPDLDRVGDNRWQFSLTNGSVVPVHARLDDTWLELTAELPRIEATRQVDAEWWLRLNARLDGPARAAQVPRADLVCLRADVSLEPGTEEEPGVEAEVTSACQEILSALHFVQGGPNPAAPSIPSAVDATAAEQVKRFCVEAGWPCTSRATGDLLVDLDTRVGVFSARLDMPGAGTLRATVELRDLAPYSFASRRAVALLLLSASASVRSVKGLLVERAGAEVVAVGAAAPWPRSPAALGRSLSALSVACRSVGREVQAICDEALAREYLARWDVGCESDASAMKEEDACLQQL